MITITPGNQKALAKRESWHVSSFCKRALDVLVVDDILNFVIQDEKFNISKTGVKTIANTSIVLSMSRHHFKLLLSPIYLVNL